MMKKAMSSIASGVRKAQLEEHERKFRIQFAAGVGFCWLEGTAAAPIFICSLTARITAVQAARISSSKPGCSA
jgi:hypothetical protein